MTELYILLQRLLPAFALGRFVHWLSRRRNPWLKNLLIRGFIRLYAVDTAEAERSVPDGYASFNDFFTRRLKTGARPVDPAPEALSCPADGRIHAAGQIRDGQLLQAKGMYFETAELCGDPSLAAAYSEGSFVTVYLAPYNYHRVHAPLSGTLRSMQYLPGARLAVNQTTAAAVPRLFSRNERLACHFDADWGPFTVVLVGALNVASISTAWAGEVLPLAPRHARSWSYPDASGPRLQRGDELGHFNLGSTVILLLPPDTIQLDAGLRDGETVRVGQRLGRLAPPHLA
ncbi:MAG: archaetidylserine decarboxylase [Gammaproteobacteria bacterium]|nr:archaetidylserine decarboxylase [Gammaproteobacteria bacterium]